MEAAQEAVKSYRDSVAAGSVGAEAAAARLVGQLDDFDRAILSARLWVPHLQSQRVVAERLGVHPVRVQRNQPRAQARFAELLADPAHQEVGEHAAELCRRLGPTCLPMWSTSNCAVSASTHPVRPLRCCCTSPVRTDVVASGLRTPQQGATCKQQPPSMQSSHANLHLLPTPMLHALTDLGIPSGIALTYLESQVALRRFGDVWVRWAGDSAVNAALSEHDRFIRASRRPWGLRAWGITEYAGIAHAIGARIDVGGGKANVQELVTDLLAAFPDVAESSIRAYLSTLEFITQAGMVRRRISTDEWPPVPPLNTVRGAFRNGHNEIRLALPVTADVLRGSGQAIHPAVATAVGVTPGQRRTFASRPVRSPCFGSCHRPQVPVSARCARQL